MQIKIHSKFWFILGIVFILLDPILAHLSNSNNIQWPAGWNMSEISPVISRILIGGGIIFLIVAYFKLNSEKKSNRDNT
jgi:hypothetical protein